MATPSPGVQHYQDDTTAIDAYQQALIIEALDQVQGNHTATAKGLGLQHTHFLGLLKALHLDD